jgi:hypothetical protein
LRNKVKDIKQMGRSTRGVRLIGLQSTDRVASLARIADAELKSVGAAPAAEAESSKNGAGGET